MHGPTGIFWDNLTPFSLKCAPGMMGCEAVPGSANPHGAEGKEWVHTITGTYAGSGTVVAAHFHCHAPTCLSMRMYRDWNGTHGTLLCEEKPIYGGTGHAGSSPEEKKFDQPGYILVPPCLWCR